MVLWSDYELSQTIFDRHFNEYELLTKNAIYIDRTKGIGLLSRGRCR